MIKTIRDIEKIKSKKVLLRTDFNVPLKGGQIIDNNRILESLPTIKELVSKGARIIIASHLGRPNGVRDQASSLRPVKNELERLLDMKISLSSEVTGERSQKLAEELSDGQVMMIENLRWEKGEEQGDETFAKELASLADIYVNDAFGVSHRPHASVYTITKLLPSYAGLLLEKEIESLSVLLEEPHRPFTLILGGAKIADKISIIENLAPRLDNILVGGAMANTFLVASGQDVSESLFEKESVNQAKEYLTKYSEQIVLPIDQVSEKTETGFKIYDIGQHTICQFVEIIEKAKTIFWNGSLGYTEDSRYRDGTTKVAEAITKNTNCFSVLAGGDTVAAVGKLTMGFSFVSTGGGASLEFLAGKKLPGIEVLEK